MTIFICYPLRVIGFEPYAEDGLQLPFHVGYLQKRKDMLNINRTPTPAADVRFRTVVFANGRYPAGAFPHSQNKVS